jgi:hypothetical protein
MLLRDNVSYFGRSNDSREKAVVQLVFQDDGNRVLLTAELPDGTHCTGRFILSRDYRALGFLPPPVHDYVGTLDLNQPEPCADWSRSGAQELLLHVSYHPLVNRYRVGLSGNADGRRVAGDWLVIKDTSPPR